MSDPLNPTRAESSGVFWRLLPRRRGQWFAIGSGAALIVTAGAAWCLLRSGPEPGGHSPTAVCADSEATFLRADVDSDGQLDEIHDPNRDGVAWVVFHHGEQRSKVNVDKARGFWQKFWAATDAGMETRGTFGDFDGDGYLDLALFYSQHDDGDSTRDNMPVHEVRYGPLARDLSGSRTGTIRIRRSSFVYGVRTTDENIDGRAELQVFQSTGDGSVSRYIGHQEKGGVAVSEKAADFYGVADWPPLELGWRNFHICDPE